MLDVAPDPFVAAVYRTGPIIALEELLGRVQVFGDAPTLAKYWQREWPSECGKQASAEMMHNRWLN